MKTGKYLAALLILIAVVFSGCMSDNTQNIDSSKDPVELIGDGLDYACEKNKLAVLLADYDNVRVSYTYKDEKGPTELYFKKDGEYAKLVQINGADDKKDISGFYRGLEFYKENGRIKAYLDVNEYKSDKEPYVESAVSNIINGNDTVTSVEESGETIIIEAKGAAQEASVNLLSTYILDKKTLRLMEARFTDEEGSFDTRATIEVNTDDGGLTAEYLSGWNDLRNITFVYERLSEDGSMTSDKVTIKAPVSWEVLPIYYEQIFMYMNSDMTVEYSYPGGTEDYTVYVTNAAG